MSSAFVCYFYKFDRQELSQPKNREAMERCVWRLHCSVLFSNFERCGILDPNDDIQLWCLHHVFIPVINSHLTNWKNAWFHHPLRAERNTTPMQLWITGLQRLWGTGSSVGKELFEVQVVFPHSIYSYNVLHKLLHAHGTVLQGSHASLESP